MRDGFPNSLPEAHGASPSPRPVRISGRIRSRLAIISLALGAAAVLALGMHLPQELIALSQNRDQIRALQVENNDLKKRLDERRERLRNLKENLNEQELEIRRTLRLYKPGDTVFIIPPKTESQTPSPEPSGN